MFLFRRRSEHLPGTGALFSLKNEQTKRLITRRRGNVSKQQKQEKNYRFPRVRFAPGSQGKSSKDSQHLGLTGTRANVFRYKGTFIWNSLFTLRTAKLKHYVLLFIKRRRLPNISLCLLYEPPFAHKLNETKDSAFRLMVSVSRMHLNLCILIFLNTFM